MENSIEEDIKILEELRIANENCIKNAKNKDNPFVTIWGKQNRALEHILSDYKRVLKENEQLNKKVDLMENYMVENGWEICFDNIYAELNNCNGMERDWCRGDKLEKQEFAYTIHGTLSVKEAQIILNLIENQKAEIEKKDAEYSDLKLKYEQNLRMCKHFRTELNKQDKIIDEMTYYLSGFDIDAMCEKCDRCIGNGCYADDDVEFKINCIKQYFENKVTDTNVGERKVENGN